MMLDVVQTAKAKGKPRTNNGWGHPNSMKNLVPFEKGKSGNPNGRPKKDKQLADKIQSRDDELVKALFDIALADNDGLIGENKKPISASERIQAINTLLDRGYGKAPQTLDVNQRHSLSDELEQHIRELNGLPPMLDVTPDE